MIFSSNSGQPLKSPSGISASGAGGRGGFYSSGSGFGSGAATGAAGEGAGLGSGFA